MRNLQRSRKLGLEKIFILLALLSAGLIVLVSHYHLLSQSTNRNDAFVDQKQQKTNHVKDEISRQKRAFLRTDATQHSGSSFVDPTTSNVAVDPTSIPSFFTPVTEQHLHNGRVVQELSRRVLSRNIAQSNVVVMSPAFGGKSLTSDGNLYPAKLAIEQAHTTHLLPITTNLSLGWNNYTDTPFQSQKQYNSTSVSWILLAYFSTAKQQNNEHFKSIDDILSPSNAGEWLKQTTITYLVFPIQANATLSYSSIFLDQNSIHSFEYHRDYLRDAKLSFTGLKAAETMLGQNYKLQLLASSHHFDAAPIPVNNDGWDEELPAFDYSPNALFMSSKALHHYLYQRVMKVLEQEVRHILDHYPRIKHQSSQSRAEKSYIAQQHKLEVHFHSLLFATQGLDLAIPARSSYTDVGQHESCTEAGGSHRQMTRCDPKLGARALNDQIFLPCPSRHNAVQVRFGMEPWEITRRTSLEKSHGISINLHGNRLEYRDLNSGEMEVWFSANTPEQSEAVCIKTNNDAIFPSVACTTRIIPNNNVISNDEMLKKVGNRAPHDNTVQSATKNGEDERTNLLFIMIDPLSRLQLKRSLPNTWALLELLGFVDFVQYTAVGNNSGPNQVALYSGMKLEGGRQGIKGSVAPKEGGDKERLWLWDRLKSAGYKTMKIEDGCVSNSNMVQSIGPQTHHGQQLYDMFCYSYDRPNCLGGSLMAEHAINYTQQFIDTYSNRAEPWAAFISFIDSHEDSSTLISYLDEILLDFIQSIPLKNTLIVFTSDHGLHYGPTFASNSGEVERAMPQLSMRLPAFQKQMRKTMQDNAKLFTTAFDVHKTIIDVLLEEKHNELPGLSLVEPLPDSRKQCQSTDDIPSQFCPKVPRKGKKCRFMVDPPSILSFYSDIPQNNRPRWPEQCPMRRNHNAIGNEIGPCQCATNDRDWFDCSTMSREGFRDSINLPIEHFSLRSCGNHESDNSLELEIHVKKNQQLLDERGELAKDVKSNLAKNDRNDVDIRASYDGQPNIIFLEIDSVSLSFSERFFPKTWGLLQKHKIHSGTEGSLCPTGWCAGMFNQSSVVGQNSIVNQLAALSGCLDQDDPSEKLHHYKSSNGKTSHCPASGENSLGTDGSTMNSDHWIFDVAKKLGYVTFFGEEFCYEDSPYVVQSQSAFTLDVDLTLDQLFCHLAKDWLKSNGKVISQKRTYNVEYHDDEVPDSCFDGRSRGEIGLEYISQMWDAYESVPKFAYLNALAAHDYSLDAAHMPLSSENYDSTVFRFLSNVMARNDSKDTFIVLRSDHGLQGGPHPIDYATQIEHMHPFTAIIAPAKHSSLSIEQFASNQNRLATGFDIYHSIRYLMSASLNEDKAKSELLFDYGIPRWSYNLLRQSIPLKRNCKRAKIPKKFCPCIDERSDMAPGFYVGHSEQFELKKYNLPTLEYDMKRQQFVAAALPGQFLPKRQVKDVALNRNVPSPVCNTSLLDDYIDTNMLEESWQLIDNITSLFPKADVSGGIFLYPRQAMLLVYLVQREIALRTPNGSRPDKLKPFRVCETGFGSGHSAALFLSSAPNVELVTFDKFDRSYQTATFSALRSLYGKRLSRVVGDSCITVKEYKKQCDFLHGSSLCQTDNIDLIAKSASGVTLTSTAMSSLTDKSVYFGKGAQWATLWKGGCIEDIVCFGEEERKLSADLYLARGREQTIAHQFCFARSTGKCVSESTNALKQQKVVLSKRWHKEDFCHNWMVETPTIETH